MVFLGSLRNAFQNMKEDCQRRLAALTYFSCGQNNVKVSSTPDKEESSLGHIVSTTQLANNILPLDYPPYVFLMCFKELFSHVSMRSRSFYPTLHWTQLNSKKTSD